MSTGDCFNICIEHNIKGTTWTTFSDVQKESQFGYKKSSFKSWVSHLLFSLTYIMTIMKIKHDSLMPGILNVLEGWNTNVINTVEALHKSLSFSLGTSQVLSLL